MGTKTEIPLIDFAGVRAREPAAMQRAARQVFDACNSVGFFYIHDHGVPQALIDNALALARGFFAHPVEVKRQVAAN